MSWNIETKKDGDITKYRIWSTIVDEHITPEWLTRDEIIKFLFWHRFREFMEKHIEDSVTFPNKWSDRSGNISFNEKRASLYPGTMYKAFDDDEYFTKVFCSEMKRLGIELSVSDGTNGFDSKEI